MPNIHPVDPRQHGPSAHILDNVRRQLGVVPNIFATLAHSPSALQGFLAFTAGLSEGFLDPGLREKIALAVAGENRCDYCASAHTALARGAGVAPEEAARNLRGESEDNRVAAILSFVKSVVHKRGHLDSAEIERLRAHDVGDAELVEILAHVGVNLFTNYFNHVAGTDIDFPVVSTATATRAA